MSVSCPAPTSKPTSSPRPEPRRRLSGVPSAEGWSAVRHAEGRGCAGRGCSARALMAWTAPSRSVRRTVSHVVTAACGGLDRLTQRRCRWNALDRITRSRASCPCRAVSASTSIHTIRAGRRARRAIRSSTARDSARVAVSWISSGRGSVTARMTTLTQCTACTKGRCTGYGTPGSRARIRRRTESESTTSGPPGGQESTNSCSAVVLPAPGMPATTTNGPRAAPPTSVLGDRDFASWTLFTCSDPPVPPRAGRLCPAAHGTGQVATFRLSVGAPPASEGGTLIGRCRQRWAAHRNHDVLLQSRHHPAGRGAPATET